MIAEAPPLHDLEARARWHLGLGYNDAPPDYVDAHQRDDDEAYDPDMVTCWGCGGEGTVVHCIDDLCVSASHCMHGDGDSRCDVCGGEGVL